MSNFVTLLVEDDVFQREILSDLLKDEGYEVVECTTAEAAELAKCPGPSLLNMPGAIIRR
jgi:CheY-like chemotaxis protein